MSPGIAYSEALVRNGLELHILCKVLEISPAAIVVTDPTGAIEYTNPAFERATGYTAAEVAGQNPRILKSGSQGPEVYTEIWRTISSGGTWTGPLHNRRKDGSLYWESAVISPLLDDKGNILHYIAVKENVTPEVEANEHAHKALKDSEVRFRSYFDLPLHGVCITSPEKGWIDVNDRLCAILGYAHDELVLKTWAEMTHPDDLAADVERFERILSGQLEQYRLEKRFLRKDGTIVWTTISVGCVRQSDGAVQHVVCVIDDITERKRAESALATLSLRNQTLLQAAVDGIHVLDENGNVIEANAAFCRMLGYTIDEALKLNVRDWDVQWEGAELIAKVREIAATPVAFETRHRRKDGTILDVEISGVCVQLDGSKYLYASARDITQRKRADEALRNEISRRQALEQEVKDIAESEQRRIGYDLHDGICQELSGIQYVTELIAQRLPAGLPEKALLTKTVADIRKAILHTRHLSHGLIPLALNRTGLPTALSELATATQGVYGISCRFSCPEHPDISSSDMATHLYRIAQEAVQNAIRHGKATSIEISLLTSRPKWKLTVSDNGVGTPSQQRGNSGRGLHIMRARANMIEASIKVQFRKKSGTFVVCRFSP